MRGISLEEIAEATKIGTRALRALEDQDFDKLPGGIFNKGFVRAYSRYLGIDEEQAVSDYLAALAEAQASGRAARPEAEASSPAEKNLGTLDDEQPRVPHLAWGVLVLVALVLAGVLAGGRYLWRHGWPQLRAPQVSGKHVRPPAPAVSASTNPAPRTEPAAPSAVQPAGADGGFTLRVRATKSTWVLLIVDGRREMSGILPADAEREVRARRRVVFKVGNAAAVELFKDGKPLPLLGEEEQVRQVTITAEGITPEVKSKKAE
jgi:cytoskeletal protein RodZ